MSVEAILKRKLLLKTQAVRILNDERQRLRWKLTLMLMRSHYEKRMDEEYDRTLSKILDCLDILINEL